MLDGCVLDVATTGDASYADVAVDMQLRFALGSSGAVGGAPGAGAVDPGEAVRWLTELEGLETMEPGEVLDDAGHVLVHASDAESGEGVLVALDVTNGSEVWRIGGVDTRCPAVPLGDGRIAVVGREGGPLDDPDNGGASLAILDAAGGTRRGDLGSAGEGQQRFTSCRYSARHVGTTVVYTDGRTVWGWDAGTDSPELAWTHHRSRRGMEEVAVADGWIVWAEEAADRPGIDAVLLDPATGAVRHEVSIPGRTVSDRAAAIVASGTSPATVVLTTRGDPTDDGVVGTMVGLRIDDGLLSPMWTRVGRSDDADSPDDLRSLTIGGDTVIARRRRRALRLRSRRWIPTLDLRPAGVPPDLGPRGRRPRRCVLRWHLRWAVPHRCRDRRHVGRGPRPGGPLRPRQRDLQRPDVRAGGCRHRHRWDEGDRRSTRGHRACDARLTRSSARPRAAGSWNGPATWGLGREWPAGFGVLWSDERTSHRVSTQPEWSGSSTADAHVMGWNQPLGAISWPNRG